MGSAVGGSDAPWQQLRHWTAPASSSQSSGVAKGVQATQAPASRNWPGGQPPSQKAVGARVIVGAAVGSAVGRSQAALQLASTAGLKSSHSQSAQSPARRAHDSHDSSPGVSRLLNSPGGQPSVGTMVIVGACVGFGDGNAVGSAAKQQSAQSWRPAASVAGA